MSQQLIKITKNYQITLPAKLRKKFSIKEGDYLEADVKSGAFIFKPKKIVDDEHDPEQAWFWTKEWQKKEKEVDEYIKKGKVKTFNTMNDLIKELKSL